ncbi:hypothetical protein M758_8G178000 [Ceratodon purpureus]|uniref:Transmembrane protein n=1 Tax=Ceratodon purpureus TaxID=3225 RepID=A0A8T0H4J7_CERPU|nr:hypothetical protein KC19_8G182900 [Ceratodon purpureus]KAG0609350.1 hypothetical protein M758_8G178000 [Ceratodon purpureus]
MMSSSKGQSSTSSIEGDQELQPLVQPNNVIPPEPQPSHHPELAGIHLGLTEEDIEMNENINIDDEDDALQPYYEVKSLLWIKRNTVYSVALEEWDRKVKLLSDRVDKKEKRSGDLKNEIYQLVGFFSVFQGVVLTAVTQLTQSGNEYHNCKKVWSPVILTALAWAVALVGVFMKLSRIQVIDDLRNDEDLARREAVARTNVLRNKGRRFKFKDFKEKDKDEAPKLYLGYSSHFWIFRFGVLVLTLSVFTGIFIASYFLILCNRGLAPINPSDAVAPAPP